MSVARALTQEEEAEEEGEAERMAEWNRVAADAAYKLEIEKAQQQQLLLEPDSPPPRVLALVLVRPRLQAPARVLTWNG